MPQFFIALAALIVGGALGWSLNDVNKDNTEPTTADEKNYELFKKMMRDCRENEATEVWAKTKKP